MTSSVEIELPLNVSVDTSPTDIPTPASIVLVDPETIPPVKPSPPPLSSLSSSPTTTNMKKDSCMKTTSKEHESNNSEDNESSSSSSSSSPPLLQFLTGMKDDVHARWPLYKNDWVNVQMNPWTVFNATIFAFVIQLIPALIFAEQIDRQTQGNLSIAETLLSSGIMGIIYAIFSGQPLVIMGITGPVALLLGTSYGLAGQFHAEYFPFFFWICVWAGILHIVSAMIGLVSLVWKVTPFTSQIFELFIAITFIYAALKDLIQPIHLGDDPIQQDGAEEDVTLTTQQRSAGYAAFFIGMITCWMAWSLHFAETWIFFSRQLRIFLTAYNTLIAVVLATVISYLPGMDQNGTLERVHVVAPWNWQPTANRSWLVHPLQGMDTAGIFAAFIPGLMFFLLFIIDHNVSSILTQSPKFNLQKPSAYHWDFFILGVTFFPCAILGLPPGNGLIPQAPLHCRALCTREFHTDAYGVRREVVTHCEEQRWSGLGQAVLMLVALTAFTVISWIPTGCLFGLLLYLGMSALHGNEIWERFLLIFVYAKKRPKIPVVRYVKWFKVQVWTGIQIACAMTIFAVAQFALVGYLYPALLTLLVPFRSYILYRLFPEEELRYLDPVNESEEDYHDEQRLVHHAFHDGDESIDEEELALPTRAEFRGHRMKRVLKHHSDPIRTVGFGESNDSLHVEVAKSVMDLDSGDSDHR